eukprot:1092979-Rhodomonas_salina.1
MGVRVIAPHHSPLPLRNRAHLLSPHLRPISGPAHVRHRYMQKEEEGVVVVVQEEGAMGKDATGPVQPGTRPCKASTISERRGAQDRREGREKAKRTERKKKRERERERWAHLSSTSK